MISGYKHTSARKIYQPTFLNEEVYGFLQFFFLLENEEKTKLS